MSGKKAKEQRNNDRKTWQHLRRQHRGEWNQQKWNEAIDMLFAMSWKHRCGFAWRLIRGKKIEYKNEPK